MSLSKIIKAGDAEHQIETHSFESELKGDAGLWQAAGQKPDAFVPLHFFDQSELPHIGKFIVDAQYNQDPEPEPDTEEEPPPPPGSFITDDDLNQQLSESFQKGLQEGRSKVESELFNVFSFMRTAAEGLLELREKALRDSESDLLKLSVVIAEKVIAGAVEQDQGIVLRLIKTAIKGLNDQEELLIRLHPEDHQLLARTSQLELQQALSGIKFQLKSDAAVEKGSCLLETERGTVDASFTAQLDEIYRRFQEDRTAVKAMTDMELKQETDAR